MEANIRASGAAVISEVFRRDKGVCAACGMDTESIQKECRKIYFTLWQFSERRVYWTPDRWVKDQWGPYWSMNGATPWQADHILPVAEGGGVCGLENYRTLCLRCHKLDTAQLSGRLAERRKGEK
jgi:5-methylcytosine-specific restriction endonuclease McrA